MPILIPHIEFVVASMGSFPLFTLLIIPCLAPFTNPSLFFFLSFRKYHLCRSHITLPAPDPITFSFLLGLHILPTSRCSVCPIEVNP